MTEKHERLGELLNEWSKLITELTVKEKRLTELKDIIFEKEQHIINETDFKKTYGKNNADVRKLHLKRLMKNEYLERKELELSIDWINRRVTYLKELIRTKRLLIEIRE